MNYKNLIYLSFLRYSILTKTIKNNNMQCQTKHMGQTGKLIILAASFLNRNLFGMRDFIFRFKILFLISSLKRCLLCNLGKTYFILWWTTPFRYDFKIQKSIHPTTHFKRIFRSCNFAARKTLKEVRFLWTD